MTSSWTALSCSSLIKLWGVNSTKVRFSLGFDIIKHRERTGKGMERTREPTGLIWIAEKALKSLIAMP